MRPRILQRAAVLMHFDEGFANLVYDGAAAPPLTDDERALLRRVDRRAFRTDPERPLRLLAALLEEYPVSCAVVGVGALSQFFATSVFKNAIMKDRLVVDAFGDWLFARAGGVAQLELAVALARRKRRRRNPAGSAAAVARAPGVELARVPLGTLAFYAAARDALARQASQPLHEAVARGARVHAAPPSTAEDALAQEHLVASPDVAPCSEPLFALLSFAREGRSRDALVAEARALGADDDADALVDDLVKDGLLAAV
jgi:hypothetical protein